MEAMCHFYSGTFGNASSIHSYGRDAREVLERARGIVAGSIGAEPGEVIFTGGGTESDNLAIMGVASAVRERDGIVTSSTEHHAVLEPCRYLEQKGHVVTFLPVDVGGRVDIEALRRSVGAHTALVSVMHANNETGTIAEIAPIAEIAHGAGAFFHTDAVQSAGKIPLDVRRLGVDLMTLSAHKMYGPKGIRRALRQAWGAARPSGSGRWSGTGPEAGDGKRSPCRGFCRGFPPCGLFDGGGIRAGAHPARSA